MAIEKTLVIIKPDMVYAKKDEEIREVYVKEGLNIVQTKKFWFALDVWKEFYSEHIGKFYFPALVLAMKSGDCVALILEGERAIERVRDLNGATNPAEAAPGTIRNIFRSAGGPFNSVHASDSVASYKKEVGIIFGLVPS